MAGPREQPWTPPGQAERNPVFAGRFYPTAQNECRRAAELHLNLNVPTGVGDRWLGGIVPHAGWMYSGAIAGLTIASLAQNISADLVVVFGAIHTPIEISIAALDIYHGWATPLGRSIVDESLRARLNEQAQLFATDDRFHRAEHAIEVELPLIEVAWPGVVVLPVEVPALENAPRIGRAVAAEVIRSGSRAVYLASSDLTHYGPGFGFTPAGVGPAGLAWAKDNDRRLLDLVTDMQIDRIVPETRSRQNACGAGAIAAMLAAVREHGASHGKILRHANSSETAPDAGAEPSVDAVGYASVVIG